MRLDTRLGLRNAHTEATRVARANACSSVRNAVSFAVMNKLMSTVVRTQLQPNVDVGNKDNGRIVVKYRERVDGNAVKVLPENGDTLSYITLLLLRLGMHVILHSCLRIIVWTGRH